MSHIEVEKGYAHGGHDNAEAPAAYRLASNPPFRPLGNPAPLGLSAFAATTFVLSLINLSTRNVTTPNIVLGMAFFYGGLCQLLAGMWEFATGNTFGATALSSYGGFWLSYAVILTPGFNVTGAYAAQPDKKMVENAIGFYLMAWFIFTFIMLVCTLRTTVAFVFLFLTLDLAFLFLALHVLLDMPVLQKAGGVFGLLAAFIAWYCALANLLTKENSFFLVLVGPLPWAPQPKRD
jgi:succinate-acetate transporter protein